MTDTSTTKRLRYHAGLESSLKLDVPSLADALWQNASLRASVDDVIKVLEQLNVEANGSVPSASIGENEFHFSRGTVYAVTEIIRLLRESRMKQDKAKNMEELQAARHIEWAWSAVLAGDIDDIRQYIEGEEAACL